MNSELGDWEADTISGKNHQQALASLGEQQAKLTRLAKVARHPAAVVKQAIIERLTPLADCGHTITSDNGSGFAAHEAIAGALAADFYLAHPYHSWERGFNENPKGLVRQHFPNGSDFTAIIDELVQAVAEQLNERPRKNAWLPAAKSCILHPITGCTS